jgi:hypothetical protein
MTFVYTVGISSKDSLYNIDCLLPVLEIFNSLLVNVHV